MGKRTAVLAAVVAFGGAAAVETVDGSGARQKNARLVRFGGCGDFLDYMKENAAPRVTAFGFLQHYGTEAVGPVPPPLSLPPGVIATPVTVASPAPRSVVEPAQPEEEFSATNVQEAGVDEPDIVKLDGSMLFAVANGKLHSVDVRGERPRRLDALALEAGARHALLLRGDTLLVLSHQQPATPAIRLNSTPPPIWPSPPEPPPPPPPPTTTLTEVDVSKPGWMKVVRRLTFQGRYLDARLVRGSARVVFSSSVPNDLRFFRPKHYAYPQEAFERNRAVIASSKAANWLPSYEIRNVRTKAKTKRFVQCRHVSRPPAFAGFGTVTVLTIDLDRGVVPVEADSVISDGELVYASEKSLYVATQPAAGRENRALFTPVNLETSLHKFDIANPTTTAYRASGTVPGYLLNQWALSEHAGVLRAATTAVPDGMRGSSVTTFEEAGGRLVALGRVDGLGRGERIFGVRFIGDVGYVVTFRQTDPLYTLDLSRPRAPKQVGELKIPGYSAYLHPLGDDLLLGLGQHGDEWGELTGTQLSVFDVSDLRKPVRVAHKTLAGGNSEAEDDHHAFLYWRPARLAVVPIEMATSGRAFRGAIGLRVGRERITEIGRVSHVGRRPSASGSSSDVIRRTVVVRNRLLTVSDAGIRATDLQTFADEGWVAFP